MCLQKAGVAMVKRQGELGNDCEAKRRSIAKSSFI